MKKNVRNSVTILLSGLVLSFAGIAYASDDDNEIKIPKTESSESPKPIPSGSESPEPSESPTPTPVVTPTPTPTVKPTPTPTPIPTYIWPYAPKELSGSDPKHNEISPKEVLEEDTKFIGCGKSVVFKLSGPTDAVYTVVVNPRHGTLHINTVNHTATWIPNKGYCQIGGNDGFVLRWVDSKGNKGTITKMIRIIRQGDVPNMIRTGM